MDERAFFRLLGPYARRLGNLLARGVVSVVNAAAKMQILQVQLLAGEGKAGLEHFEPYGYTAHPHPGAEVLAAFFDGDRSHGIVIVAADRRYRIKNLAAGEVALYTDEDVPDGLHRIVMKRGQEIHLVAGASSIVMKPTGITITTPSLDIIKA
jgi:phage baseplate assembly protein V